MLSNEQRAHDIAVAMLPKMIDIRINEKTNQMKSGIAVPEFALDIYQEYKTLYELALTPFNRDFPEGK